ncbi:hypothetical protein L5515_002024 [Caenorhabditis briggsae]|uniref:Uncharacterized protein n=1 Tax=Caenorhabditis briggsae TaxID=6238 RepID=A0AAE9E4N9_CAEBR|nr:hypothetical protein L5515_002024 [Caenorhabditis briggsae]
MQAWEYRETDSPLSSDVTLHSLKPVETDSAMSIASDFDETFWDQELNRGRSQSFGGTTQYSQQFMQRKIIGRPFFKTSLETVDSGTNRLMMLKARIKILFVIDRIITETLWLKGNAHTDLNVNGQIYDDVNDGAIMKDMGLCQQMLLLPRFLLMGSSGDSFEFSFASVCGPTVLLRVNETKMYFSSSILESSFRGTLAG